MEVSCVEVRSFGKSLERLIKSDLTLFVSIFLSWSLLEGFYPLEGTHAGLSDIAGLLSAALATTLIRSDRQRVLRLIPRWSDLATFSVALPIATVMAELFIRLFGEASSAPLSQLGVLAFCTGMLSFLGYRCIMCIGWRMGARRNIYCDITDEELSMTTECLRLNGIQDQVSIGTLHSLKLLALANRIGFVDALVVSRNSTDTLANKGVFLRSVLGGAPTFEVVDMLNSLDGRIRLKSLDPVTYLTSGIKQGPALRLLDSIKSVVEPIVALLLLVIISPLLVIIALAIKWDSEGPVLYVQKRLGFQGKVISVIKFRSMFTDAEAQGPRWASSHDTRITRVGAVLRKVRLDELPQLINVLRGDMGFVGPRPERPEFYEKVREEIPLFYLRTLVKPGITGWAQVKAGYAASVEESKCKLEYDLFYIKNMTPRLELLILLKTVFVTLTGSERKDSLRKVPVLSNNVVELSPELDRARIVS